VWIILHAHLPLMCWYCRFVSGTNNGNWPIQILLKQYLDVDCNFNLIYVIGYTENTLVCNRNSQLCWMICQEHVANTVGVISVMSFPKIFIGGHNILFYVIFFRIPSSWAVSCLSKTELNKIIEKKNHKEVDIACYAHWFLNLGLMISCTIR